MIDFIVKIIKQFGVKKTLEIIIKLMKWIASKTNAEWDDEVCAKLEELYLLLYPFIPEKKRR